MSENQQKMYPYLPEGRTILYVSSSNPFMQEAERVCHERSTDKNHSTGSVVVMNDKVIGSNANKAGFKNPFLIGVHQKGICVRRFLKIKSGQKYWLCPGCASPENHSESLAVKDALSKNGKINGADLYLWGHWWCCEVCWNNMIKAGIRDVYLLDRSIELFK